MSREHKRLLSVTPIPTGWRAIYSFDSGSAGDLSELPDDDLFYVMPVAALATVEVWDAPHGYDAPEGPWDQNLAQYVQPLVASEGDLFDWRDDQDPLALLGPGEDVGPSVRLNAIREIELKRSRLEARRVAASA